MFESIVEYPKAESLITTREIMHYLSIVVNTTGLLRDGTRFTVGALVSTCWDNALEGVPQFIAHDQSRHIGWAYSKTIFFQPGLSRVRAIGHLASTDEESEVYKKALLRRRSNYLNSNKTLIERLRILIAPHLQGHEKLVDFPNTVALVEVDLAKRVFPEIFENMQLDKDNLIPLNKLETFRPGVFRSGDLLLYAHPYFRRAQYRLNPLNSPFLTYLASLNSNLRPRIALDPDMVGIIVDDRGIEMEHQYWWGPKFNDDLLSVPRGVTVHRADENEKLFFSIDKTEFRWGNPKEKGGIFEVEELRLEPSPLERSDIYCCRYAHSIVNDNNKIIHMDGAIRAYHISEMLERLDADISTAGRHTEYTKLWRIDGETDVVTWKRLLSDYFRDNHLVGEYLGGEEESESIELNKKTELNIIEEYVPYTMKQGMQIRVAMSFVPKYDADSASSNWSVIPTSYLNTEGERIPIAEDIAFELSKAMERVGGNLEIPDNISFINFKDGYINFPSIYHQGENLQESIQVTLSAIKLLVKLWNSQNRDMVISFSLRYPVADRDIWLSFMGHIQDIELWLLNASNHFPTDENECRSWGEELVNFLGNDEELFEDMPPMSSILAETGDLYIERIQLKTSYELLMVDTQMSLKIKASDLSESLLDAFNLGKIRLAPSQRILSSKCSICDSEYARCSHSKLLDGGVVQNILEADNLLFFWTDRTLI